MIFYDPEALKFRLFKTQLQMPKKKQLYLNNFFPGLKFCFLKHLKIHSNNKFLSFSPRFDAGVEFLHCRLALLFSLFSSCTSNGVLAHVNAGGEDGQGSLGQPTQP